MSMEPTEQVVDPSTDDAVAEKRRKMLEEQLGPEALALFGDCETPADIWAVEGPSDEVKMFTALAVALVPLMDFMEHHEPEELPSALLAQMMFRQSCGLYFAAGVEEDRRALIVGGASLGIIGREAFLRTSVDKEISQAATMAGNRLGMSVPEKMAIPILKGGQL